MPAPDLRSDETRYNDERVHRAVAAERERIAKLADESGYGQFAHDLRNLNSGVPAKLSFTGNSVGFVLIALAVTALLSCKQAPTPDQLFGCKFADVTPSGECR